MGAPGGGGRDGVFATSDGKGFVSLLDARMHLAALQQDPAQHPSIWNFLVYQLSPITKTDKDATMAIDMKAGPYRTNAHMETKPRCDPDPDDLMRRWVLETTDDEWRTYTRKSHFDKHVDALQHKTNTRVQLVKTRLSAKIIYDSGVATLHIRMPWSAGRAMRARIKRAFAKEKAEQERRLDERRRELDRDYEREQIRLRKEMVESISDKRVSATMELY